MSLLHTHDMETAQLQKRSSELDRVKRELTATRDRLEAESTPSGPHVLVAPRLQWAHRLAAERWEALRELPGVAGYAVGHRKRDGVDEEELALIVFVRRKRTTEYLRRKKLPALPKTVRKGKRILPVDVQELGGVELQSNAVAGASIGRGPTPRTKGTLGAPAIDNLTGSVVGIASMHVFGPGNFAANGIPPIPASVPSRLDKPSAAIFAAVVLGFRKVIDAAKLILAPGNTIAPFIPQIGAIRGWRPIHDPGDKNTSVRLYGAETGFQRGVIVEPRVNLQQSAYRDVVLVGGMTTEKGDSGAAMVDAQNHVLGFLIGRAKGKYEGLRVFCPAGLVLSLLSCDIPKSEG
jgi:hypothetical protein